MNRMGVITKIKNQLYQINNVLFSFVAAALFFGIEVERAAKI